MAKPPFVMSKYLNKTDLLEDKAAYYVVRCDSAEKALAEVMADLENDGALSFDAEESAKAHLRDYVKEDGAIW